MKERARITRFLASGLVNTAATYALYLLLLRPFGHRWAYGAAFAAGIVFAYVLYRGFVFREHGGARSAIGNPLMYGAQFLIGLAIVEAWTVWLDAPAAFGPLAALAVTVPLTYLASRWIFTKK
ncbi:MAG: GtrA family protein [Pseudomonadota bacterium]